MLHFLLIVVWYLTLWWQLAIREWVLQPSKDLLQPPQEVVLAVVAGPVAGGKSVMAEAMARQLGPRAVFIDGDSLPDCVNTLTLGSHRNDSTVSSVTKAYLQGAKVVLIAAGGKALLTNCGKTQRNYLKQLLLKMGFKVQIVYVCMSAPQLDTSSVSISGWMTAEAFDANAEVIYKLDPVAFKKAFDSRVARGVPMASLAKMIERSDNNVDAITMLNEDKQPVYVMPGVLPSDAGPVISASTAAAANTLVSFLSEAMQHIDPHAAPITVARVSRIFVVLGDLTLGVPAVTTPTPNDQATLIIKAADKKYNAARAAVLGDAVDRSNYAIAAAILKAHEPENPEAVIARLEAEAKAIVPTSTHLTMLFSDATYAVGLKQMEDTRVQVASELQGGLRGVAYTITFTTQAAVKDATKKVCVFVPCTAQSKALQAIAPKTITPHCSLTTNGFVPADMAKVAAYIGDYKAGLSQEPLELTNMAGVLYSFKFTERKDVLSSVVDKKNGGMREVTVTVPSTFSSRSATLEYNTVLFQ